MITHLDAAGNDTPAVPLERLVAPGRAANIPEFVALPADAIASIRESFLDAMSHLRAGTERFTAGDPAAAERHFRAGLTLASADTRLRFCLGMVLAGQGRLDEAIICFRETVRLDSGNSAYHAALARALLARALLEHRSTEEAAQAARTALDLARKAGNQEEFAIATSLLSLCETKMSDEREPAGR
jgi:tetratricopeptide (TPR) repeat protein